METFLVLSLMKEDGKAVFVGAFIDMMDLENCCHSGHVYAIGGIKQGIPFTTTNFTVDAEDGD